MRRFGILSVTVGLLLGSATALAEGEEVTVQVGQTKHVDAGYSKGYRCDDPSLIDADWKTDEKTGNNDLMITGKKEGQTTCRIGTGLSKSRVVKIKVEKAHPAEK